MIARTICALFLVTLTFSGCTGNKPDSPVSSNKAAPVDANELLVRLEEADLLDGTKDHIIGKCYVCNLGMDGSDKFAVKINDYTAHLCSPSCEKEFASTPETIVLHTAVPKKP